MTEARGIRLRYMANVNPRPTRALKEWEQVSFIPMECVGVDGSLDLSQTKRVDEIGQGYTYFEEGDVSVAKITPCFENGKGAVMSNLEGKAGFGTTELIVLRPEQNVDPSFLYLVTQTDVFRKFGEAAMLGSGGQKRIPEAFVKDFRLCWPSLEHQQQISHLVLRELSRIDCLLAEKRLLISKVEALRASIISDAITHGIGKSSSRVAAPEPWLGSPPSHWRRMRLKDAVEGCFNGAWGDDPRLDGSDIPVVRVADFDRVRRIALGSLTIRNIEKEKWSSRELRSGDLLIEKSGGGDQQPVGMVVQYLGEPGTICSNFVARMRPRTFANSRFLTFVHAHLYSQGVTRLSIKQSTGIQNLDDGAYLVEHFYLPPLEDQIEIAEHLDTCTTDIDSLRAHVEREIELLGEIRSCTINDAVLGRIGLTEFQSVAHVEEAA